MAEALTIEVKGMRELQKKAASLDTKMERRAYSKSVRAASKPVLAKAKAKAPGRTGALKSSIKARANNKPSKLLFGMKLSVVGGKFSSEKSARRRGSGNTYRPDETIRYYRFQELGTKHHPAKPFLAPALEASAGEFLRTLKSELHGELERNTKAL